MGRRISRRLLTDCRPLHPNSLPHMRSVLVAGRTSFMYTYSIYPYVTLLSLPLLHSSFSLSLSSPISLSLPSLPSLLPFPSCLPSPPLPSTPSFLPSLPFFLPSLFSFPPFLPPSLPTFLPPSLPSSLPPYLPHSLTRSFPLFPPAGNSDGVSSWSQWPAWLWYQ